MLNGYKAKTSKCMNKLKATSNALSHKMAAKNKQK